MFKVMDFPEEIPAKSFDVVILCEVLEHLEKDEVALGKVFRLLKKGGIAVVSVPSRNAPLFKMGYTKEFDKRVEHLRRYDLKELVRIYNESLVTLSLSRFDTFGLVPLESMSCGTPVIALNVAGYRETVLDGKTGFLVEFDSSEIADKIIYFADDLLLSTKMGKEGRKWIENKWSWEKNLYNMEGLLKEFIEK